MNSSKNNCDDLLVEASDFKKLRDILSSSPTRDAYCRSALYYVFTGRGQVWTIKHRNNYLILLRHPNVIGCLLVFFPFISNAFDLAEQVNALCRYESFLMGFNEVLLARIPAPVAEGLMNKALHLQNTFHCMLENVDEKKLDWAYPSYDVQLKKLLTPEGGKLETYRNKIRKFHRFNKFDVKVIRPDCLDEIELRKIVTQITKSWIRTKSKNGSVRPSRDILRELIDPYAALVRLRRDITLAVDGLILKRGEAYLAFSFWERPANGDTVPCFAALPCSYEKGLSEYLHYCIADCLEREGYASMCIGGSETASLDQFKKKLDPINIHRLQTIRVSPKDQPRL
jgi:hypothetical protein